MRLLKREFCGHLESKAPKTKVGYRGHGSKCPIAQYYKSKGFIGVAADGLNVSMYDKDYDVFRNVKTPVWARKFMNYIDHDAANPEDAIKSWKKLQGSSVSARRALAYLDRC